MGTMKAMQIKPAGSGFELLELPLPEPNDNEVLLKVEACGVCPGDVLPRVEVFPLEQAQHAVNRMMNAGVRFRAVLKMN